MAIFVKGGGGGGAADGNDAVKVSSNDTTAGFLNGKLVAGTNVTFTEGSDGGDETLTIAAAGGVTGFTGSQNTASPNNTVNASRLLVDATSTNADFVAQPKGTGAIMVQLPDGTVTGGNKRGSYAVDTQMFRVQSSQVASGNYAGIIGGYYNTASGGAAGVFAGSNNRATANFSGILAGQDHLASGSLSAVIGGNDNTASGDNSVVIGGADSTASGSGSVVFGAYGSNTAAANYSFAAGRSCTTSSGKDYSFVFGRDCSNAASHSMAFGNDADVGSSANYALSFGYLTRANGASSQSVGWDNQATASFASIFGGGFASASQFGQRSHAAGQFAARGDCQEERHIQRRETTTDAQTELSNDGNAPAAATRMAIASDATYTFSGLVTARRTDADNESAGWEIKGVIDNNAGTTAIVGSVTVTALGDDSAGTWLVAVEADNTNDALVIKVTGENSKTIRWGATVKLMKVAG